MLGYKATVKKKDFKLSCEVDSAEWVKYENALAMLREGSIAWKLVNEKLVQELTVPEKTFYAQRYSRAFG